MMLSATWMFVSVEMRGLELYMRTARVIACLVIVSLMITPTFCIGGGKPKSAVLIVSRSRDAREESVARGLARQVFTLLEKRGIAQRFPILLYHFEKPDEREHCTSRLKIGPGDLPCAALVDVDAHGIPIRVKKKFPRVVATKDMATCLASSVDGVASHPGIARPAQGAPLPPPPAASPEVPATPETPSSEPTPSSKALSLGKHVPMRPDAGIHLFFGVTCNNKGLPPPVGCRIDSITPGGIAACAGLMVEDIVVRIGDTSVNSIGDVYAAMREIKNNQKATITFMRLGKEMSVEHLFQVPGKIHDFEIVEGKGLPGLAAIGDYRRDILDRLGKPDGFVDAGSGSVWAEYDVLGVDIRFDAVGRVTAVRFYWPFVGQTSNGVRTGGKKADLHSTYGTPDIDREVGSDGGRVIVYEEAGIGFFTNREGYIITVLAFRASKSR